MAATQAATVPGAAIAQHGAAGGRPVGRPQGDDDDVTAGDHPGRPEHPRTIGGHRTPELAAWYATTGTANTTAPIGQLAADYLTAGA